MVAGLRKLAGSIGPSCARMARDWREHDAVAIKGQLEVVARLDAALGEDRLRGVHESDELPNAGIPGGITGWKPVVRSHHGRGSGAVADELADRVDCLLAFGEEAGEQLPDVDHFRPNFKFYLNSGDRKST